MAETTKTIRWGILGTANIAAKISRAIRRTDGAELLAIASRNADRAMAWAEQHHVPRAFGSYQELLEDREIDAVYIPLPPSLHHDWTIQAAEHGKHVLCEKPLAGNVDEAIEMAGACRANNVQLMDGVMWVHHDRTIQMRRQLDEGVLGTLRRVTAAFSFNWDVVPEENIRLQPRLAGGALGDLGYYCVRAILWAFGALPRRVYATARFYNNVEMNLSAMLWFDDDRTAAFDCGFDTVMRKWFEVAGTRGSLVCDDFVLPNSESKARYWIHDAQCKSTEHAVADCVQEVRMLERFCAIARSGQLEERWPTEAIQTMRVCDAIAEAARQQAVVELR